MRARVSAKGQVVIPAPLRRKYGLKKGTNLAVSEQEGQIVLRPITPDLIDSLYGSLKGSGLVGALQAERTREVRREQRRIRGVR